MRHTEKPCYKTDKNSRLCGWLRFCLNNWLNSLFLPTNFIKTFRFRKNQFTDPTQSTCIIPDIEQKQADKGQKSKNLPENLCIE